MDIDAEF
jgi:hypothetical protein